MKFIGEIIRKKRILKKYSLENISSNLHISVDILQKIENDEIDLSPNKVYFLGHIRAYSKFLDLNENEIIEQFKLQHSYKNQTNVDEIPKPINVSNFTLNKYLSAIPVIIITFVLYFVLFNDNNNESKFALIPDIPEKLEPLIEKTTIELELDEIKNNNSLESTRIQDNISLSQAIASSEIDNSSLPDAMITLKFINPTWIQIRDQNDNIILSKLMTKKDQYSYDLDLNYSVTAGNAGNILVLINDEIKGKIGEFGQVIDALIIDYNFDN